MWYSPIFSLWKIKKERAETASIIMHISAVISIAVSFFLAWNLSKEISYKILDMIMSVIAIYVLVSYIVLGWFKCYHTKRYKGHKIIRYAALIFMIIAALYISVVFFFTEFDIKYYLIELSICIPLLLGSVQCVRNGYIS